MSGVSLNGNISSVQHGMFKAFDTTSAAAKAAEEAGDKVKESAVDDRLGQNIDVKA